MGNDGNLESSPHGNKICLQVGGVDSGMRHLTGSSKKEQSPIMLFSAPICLRVQKGRRKYTGLKQSFRGEIKLVLDWRVKILSTVMNYSK